MARTWALVLALFHPADVDQLDAFIGGDASVNISWTLPNDSSVVGLTIFRDNLEDGDTTRFEIVGLTTSFVDTGADPDDDYRYWIHTRDGEGDLSAGVFVEVFTRDGDRGGHWTCSSGTARGLPSSLAFLAAALLAVLRRGR